MFLSLLLGWMLQSPACSRTHPFASALECALWQLFFLSTICFVLFCIHIRYVFHACPLWRVTRDSCSCTWAGWCSASWLGGAHPRTAALLHSVRQQHRHPPSPCCSLPYCWPHCHDCAEPSSGTATEPHCCLATLPNTLQIQPTITVTVVAGGSPSRPDRSSRITTISLVCSHHQQWVKPALVAVLNLFGSDIPTPSALPSQRRAFPSGGS